MHDLATLIVSIIFASKNPISGYDIAKIVKSKTGNSTQQVYRELKGIATIDGVVVSTVEQEGRPNKKTYTIDKDLSIEFDDSWLNSCGNEFSKTSTGYLLASMDVINGTDLLGEFTASIDNARTDVMSKIGG